VAEEGHNGYLDLAVTTGLIGLSGAILVLVRTVWQALQSLVRGIRNAAHADTSIAAFHLGFLLVLAVHNVTESTYFTANTIFGTMFLFSAVELAARPTRKPPLIVFRRQQSRRVDPETARGARAAPREG
jgi:O-antigen ligase